ncbi:hypothetical protein [Terriglobus roseus]|uniref:Uncharacterized protein n=1 Tax=Terriglobus roseus TaxID=392734 RepID=A0A1H4NR10_9BACT|nr:hypothetical protein [Terriglobus roseus]SEB97258.1 hypothetical protein SAMN05443244_2318 [Terriglobus roseus]
MIRLVLLWNAVLTVLVVVLLVGNRHDRSAKPPLQASVPQADVLRARRVEVVDHEGHVTAEFGETLDGSAAGLSLFDPNGRRAVTLALNDRGYGTLFFHAKKRSGNVAVGYFTGSDQVAPLSEEDPLGGWGILVQRPAFEAPQVFGVQIDGRPIPTSP